MFSKQLAKATDRVLSTSLSEYKSHQSPFDRLESFCLLKFSTFKLQTLTQSHKPVHLSVSKQSPSFIQGPNFKVQMSLPISHLHKSLFIWSLRAFDGCELSSRTITNFPHGMYPRGETSTFFPRKLQTSVFIFKCFFKEHLHHIPNTSDLFSDSFLRNIIWLFKRPERTSKAGLGFSFHGGW